MATFTREELEAKTVAELKEMCVYNLDIHGFTKRSKYEIINRIMEDYGVEEEAEVVKEKEALKGIEFMAQSTLTKPSAPFGHRATTTIHASCGAASGNFPLAGRTVLEVGEFLREVLNVDSLSTGLVNGNEVPGDYVLKEGDNVEFLKPAGKKG